ncbi:hypothetical protein ACFRAU_21655 [Arthrobacter sp. NPDC056691]|uniref:hypothetical protein n=1 Tax=unclassified Arthrobacter TaxID=235627 RepID=UPI00366A790F
MELGQISAVLACAVLAGLAVFQVLLMGGVPLGRLAWGGQHRILPARLRIGSAVSVLLYLVFGHAALARTGLAPAIGSDAWYPVFTWVLTAYFTLGVLMNAISRSKPERLVMTPVALLLALLFLFLSIS